MPPWEDPRVWAGRAAHTPPKRPRSTLIDPEGFASISAKPPADLPPHERDASRRWTGARGGAASAAAVAAARPELDMTSARPIYHEAPSALPDEEATDEGGGAG